MADFSIPVDLRNPGQVFACLGFAEAAEQILKTLCEVRFEFSERATVGRFSISIASETDPFATVVRFLRNAQVFTSIPFSSILSTKNKPWFVDDKISEPGLFPSPVPKEIGTLPVVLATSDTSFELHHWADGPHCGRDNVKFWAGAQGKPGSSLALDAVRIIQSLSQDEIGRSIRDPFAVSSPMTGSFRFDFRRDYIPLDAGFSPNKHKTAMTMVGYPFTEMLAIFGLQNARPKPITKLRYRYGISSHAIPLSLARIVLGGIDIGFPMRTFHMILGRPNDKARCITDSEEDI